MWKIRVALSLVCCYAVYTVFIYTTATEIKAAPASDMVQAQKGKALYHQYNCVSCHQVYGLGGYLGPDLTKVSSRYPDGNYIKAMLTVGNNIMPAYYFSEEDKAAFLAYFKYLNQHAEYK